MSLGIYGSTLNDELNRLANGGTYPDYADYKDQAGAAQAWAAAESVPLGDVTDLVGVLNYINGVTDRSKFLDLAGVCNAIAGTTGLEPAAALRQVTGAPSSYAATATVTGTAFSSAFCSPGGQAGNAGYVLNTTTGICSHPVYGDPFTPPDLQTVNVYSYTCPSGGTYNPANGMCEF